MSAELVQYTFKDAVALIRLDDGKANALSHALLDASHAALDRAAKDEAGAVALVGRPGRFSAGFDLSVMRQGPEEVAGLVRKGAELAIRLFEWPSPVVLGVTGHALAMGAVLLLTADERIGADGAFKIGLNEVAIGMTLPQFALDLARERLSKRHLYRATSGAEIYPPRQALDAGFLDCVVEPEAVQDETIRRASALGATLDGPAHRNTKRALRCAVLEQLRSGMGG